MDPAEAIEQQALTRQRAMNAVIDRGDSPVQEFYRGTTVLVTGGSGFLGKQLIEKLFRSTRIKQMFVIIRHKKGHTPEQRISQILQDPIFDVLHKNQPDFVQKIVPIEGDVAELDLGISSKDKELIVNEVNIIFHVAANVALEQELKSAILTNVRGTRDIINLAKQCQHLKSIVYVSTAFSNATISRVGEDIKEEFYPAPISPDLMISLAEGMDDERIKEITDNLIKGWVNTYTFSKVLAENIVQTYSQELPIKVVRPTIVICANREPNPGWIDISSVFGPSGLVLGCIMGVLHVLISRHEINIDFIPSDYVINAVIAAAATESQAKVYQVSSSNRNPCTWGNLSKVINNEVAEVISPKVVGYCFALETPRMWVYNIGSIVLHKIPAYIIDAVCVQVGVKPRLRKIYTTVDKLINVLQYFTTHDWRFIDSNTEELYNSMCERDKAIYHCDVADVDWTQQILLWSVGLRKYIIKDGLKGTDVGLRKQFYFGIATYVAAGVMISFLCSVLYVLFKLF